MITFDGGTLWARYPPRCPVHGPMRVARGVTPPRVLWTCAGWDGEGCGYQVDGADVPWEYVGETQPWHAR